MTKPRMRSAGDEGPGDASGGEIFAKTRILFNGLIDMTIASTEFARNEAKASRLVGEVFNGGSLSDEFG